jgi:hypothetical protein
MDDACGSQTYAYVLVACRTTSSQSTVPMKPTVVDWFTPGPWRRKLWMPELSVTLTS